MVSQERRTGAVYQHVWMSGSKGQRNTGRRHALHLRVSWVAMHHTGVCHNYVHKYRHMHAHKYINRLS